MACGPQITSLPLPSPAQIALAIVTLQSKPPQLSIEDHLESIRRCIIPSPSSSAVGSPTQIDIAQFWKDAFQRSELEKLKLQDEVEALHRKSERSQVHPQSSRKRRSASQSTTRANTRTKRKRIEQDDYQDADVEDGTPHHENPAGQLVLRGLIRLQRSMLRPENLPAVVTNIVLICQHLKAYVDSSVTSSLIPATNNESTTLPQLFPRIASSYKIIITAFDTLSSQGNHSIARCIGSLLSLFQAIFGCLHQVAINEAKRREEEEAVRRRKPRSNIKVAQMRSEEEQAWWTESTTALFRISRHLITTLDLSNCNQCQVFRNMLSALLDRVGSSLSLLVFADQQDPNNHGDLVEQPRKLMQGSHIDTKTAISAMELEAPYLVAILKSAVTLVRGSQKDLPPHSRELLSGNRMIVENQLLFEKIEKRLQDTLLRGIFGDKDEKFREAFTREPSPEENHVGDAANDDAGEDQKSEWFLGQVWELIGWDILSGKTATSDNV